VEEDQPTLAGNALKKAAAAVAVAGKEAVIMADDSGLEVERWTDAPDYTRRVLPVPMPMMRRTTGCFWKSCGAPARKRGALFRCTIAILFPDGKTYWSRKAAPAALPNPRARSRVWLRSSFCLRTGGAYLCRNGRRS